MWVITIASMFVVLFVLTLFILILAICTVSVYLNYLRPIYLLIRGKVYCRHCEKRIYMASLHNHKCLTAPQCPACKTHLAPDDLCCPKKKCNYDILGYLANCFTPEQDAHLLTQLLEEDLRDVYPGLKDRMSGRWE